MSMASTLPPVPPNSALGSISVHRTEAKETHSTSTSRWAMKRREQIYSSRLLHALRRPPRGTRLSRGREILETADKLLAASARGRTRWSRGILLASRLRARRRSTHGKEKARGRKRVSRKPRKLPALGRKLRILRRLVPGCRKVAFLDLLEEARGYILALEMQVRAMTGLAEVRPHLGCRVQN